MTEPDRPPATPHDQRHGTELDADTLRRRARLGVVALVARTVVLQLLVLAANVVLARELDPADFGVFAIVQFALSFFAFFGDAGLGGALVQRQGLPSQRELSSVFFLQLALAAVVVAIIWLSAPWLRDVWPDLPPQSEWLLRALSVGLVLTTLRTVPSLLMERELLFVRHAVLEVAGAVAFNGSAIVLALMKLGVWALVLAILVQGAVQTVLAFAMRPWKPSLVVDRAALGPIVAFGIPYQLKNLIGFVNSAVTPVYGGAKLGATPVGYVNWGMNTAFFPLRLVEILGRVTFPLFSRLQDDRATFAETLGRCLYVCAVGTFFFAGLFFGIGRELTHVVFSDKWLPAVPVLWVYAAAITIGFISPIVGAALDASGKPQIIARLAFGWTALNWLVVPIATRWGTMGFAIGYAVHVVAGNAALLVVMARILPGVRVARRVAPSLVAGLVVAGAGWALRPYVGSWLALGGAFAALLAAFAATLLVLDRRGLVDALSIIPKRQDAETAVG